MGGHDLNMSGCGQGTTESVQDYGDDTFVVCLQGVLPMSMRCRP